MHILQNSSWSLDSWQGFSAKQLPIYQDKHGLQKTLGELSSYPPLVFARDVDRLKFYLEEVCLGKAMVIQGGDCAESFQDFSGNSLRDMLRLLLQMSVILMATTGAPVVKIGRMAGQFAKPRSEEYEEYQGKKYLSYRGDLINGAAVETRIREADPQRMLRGYFQSAATLNLARAFMSGGFGGVQEVHRWILEFTQEEHVRKYQEYANRIEDMLNFMRACRLQTQDIALLSQTDLFVSHEALLLPYEQALTRQDSYTNRWYGCSAHMLWVGERTRDVQGAHIEYLRGLENPVGVKIGPSATKEELIHLCDILNPRNEAGKLTFIIRMGDHCIGEKLPRLLSGMASEGRHIVWLSDPMHGNTEKSNNGYKTRKFEKILSELEQFMDIHWAQGTHPGGIHFEMTGTEVTECTGGSKGLTEDDLLLRYHTFCDPRLNVDQSLEMMFLLAEKIKKHRQK